MIIYLNDLNNKKLFFFSIISSKIKFYYKFIIPMRIKNILIIKQFNDKLMKKNFFKYYFFL